ncbi:MAG: Clp protease ClpP [Patescibacteria group bacterium]|jgi:ATP-dependent Clp protease protease subunit
MTEYKNSIWVAGPIDNKEFYVNFTARFSAVMNSTKENDEVTVFINSPGGDTHTALGLYDLLKNCKRKTVGVVSGIAFSGASLILQACEKRLMTTNSQMMLHKSSVQVAGYVDNAQEALNTFRKLDEKFFEIYATRSGEKVKQIEAAALGDKYFSAGEALEAGLIDEII